MTAAIRLATPADAAELARIYEPYVSSSAISFELEPPTEAEFRARIAGTLPFAPWLVLTKDGEILGYAYASKHRERAAYLWSVDMAVYIRQDCHRRGIGAALYTSLIECLKLQGFYAAHAGITLPNANSVGLHEAMGFRKVGTYPAVGFKFGAWLDVGWWQLPLRDRAGTPAPPRTPKELETDPRWSAAIATGLSRYRDRC